MLYGTANTWYIDTLLPGTAHTHMKLWYPKLCLSPMLQRHGEVLPHWQCTTPQCHRRRWQQSLSSSTGWCSPMPGRETKVSSLSRWCSPGMTVGGGLVSVASSNSIHPCFGVPNVFKVVKLPLVVEAKHMCMKYALGIFPLGRHWGHSHDTCSQAIPSIFAWFKKSRTGQWKGLGTRQTAPLEWTLIYKLSAT